MMAGNVALRFISSCKSHVVPYEPIHAMGPDFSLIYDGPERSPTGEYVVKVTQCRRVSPGRVAEDEENSCLSLPHVVRSEPRTADQKNPKSRNHRPVTFRFENLNFGSEASGHPWVLRFDLSARVEDADGFKSAWMGSLLADEIHVGYNSPEEAVVRQTNYCHVCRVMPCKLYLSERLPKRAGHVPHR